MSCSNPSSRVCTPPADFAERLCTGQYPDVALALFAKDTPWTRAYVTSKVEAWNASGGRRKRTYLGENEEVLVVAAREPQPGGVVVVGAGATYDVMRWDGACVTLDEREITTKRPAHPARAAVAWRYLAEPTQKALLGAPKVATSESNVEKECAKRNGHCTRANAALAGAIAEYLKSGGSLPAPAHRP
jgi:hypothetical protein